MNIGQDDRPSVYVLNSTGQLRECLVSIAGAFVQRLSFALALVSRSAFTIIPICHIFGYFLDLWENCKVGTIDFQLFSFV